MLYSLKIISWFWYVKPTQYSAEAELTYNLQSIMCLSILSWNLLKQLRLLRPAERFRKTVWGVKNIQFFGVKICNFLHFIGCVQVINQKSWTFLRRLSKSWWMGVWLPWIENLTERAMKNIQLWHKVFFFLLVLYKSSNKIVIARK